MYMSRRSLITALKKFTISKYEEWGNEWVHYSKEPYLKINPKQMHRDPAGLYFFPAKGFDPVQMWASLPYKFTVTMPDDLRVLDLSKLSRESALELVTKVLGKPPHKDYIDLVLNQDKPHYLSNAWEAMYMQYMGKPGAFNKRFRDIGYDAIYDDTKSIASMEVQLIVLDPRKVKVKSMDKTSDSGYDDLILVMDYLQEFGENWGTVKIEKPKKKKEWGEVKLRGRVTVEDPQDENKYVVLTVSAEHYPGSSSKEGPPVIIYVSKSHASPDVKRGYGASFDRKKRSFKEIEKEMTELFSKVFK